MPLTICQKPDRNFFDILQYFHWFDGFQACFVYGWPLATQAGKTRPLFEPVTFTCAVTTCFGGSAIQNEASLPHGQDHRQRNQPRHPAQL